MTQRSLLTTALLGTLTGGCVDHHRPRAPSKARTETLEVPAEPIEPIAAGSESPSLPPSRCLSYLSRFAAVKFAAV